MTILKYLPSLRSNKVHVHIKTCKKVIALISVAFLLTASSIVSGEEISGSSTIRSVIVKRNKLLVRLSPTSKSKRRGVVMKGARLPVLGWAEGPGCNGRWFKIHENSWLCESGVSAVDLPPSAAQYPVVPKGKITPWPYAFVRQPAIEYKKSRGIYQEIREVFKGYGFGVAGTKYIDGEKYFLTAEGHLISRRAAGISGRISEFSGISLKETGYQLPIGWVNAKKAWAYSAPSRRKKFRISPVERYALFDVLEEQGKNRRRFVRFDEGTWLAGSDVRVARKVTRPASVNIDERWIDVNVKEQIVTAYIGDTPVYTTMMSSGRRGPSKTVKGEYRIWVKLAAIAMDNTDEELEETDDALDLDAGIEDNRHLFSLHDVPWTQFFFENYALHGVYWHNRFGNRRSHGCVNLSPLDARWFYDWTNPVLPNGWWAIHTAPGEQGTLVRIR